MTKKIKASTSQSMHLPTCKCSACLRAPHRQAQTGHTAQTLSISAAKLARASLAPATIRAYRSALYAWDTFRNDQTESDTLIAEYLTARYEAGASPATCTQIVGAIRFRAKHQGYTDPLGPAAQRVLAGIRRRGRDRGRGQVDGLRWPDADKMVHVAQRDHTLAGLRDAAIISVMSDALLRISECTALNIEDFLQTDLPDGSARITVRHSKTDQEGRSSILYIGPTTATAVTTYLNAAQIDDGPLFRRVRRGDHLGTGRLTTRAIRNIVKQRAAAAGVSGRFSGHSLRIGSAQSLATAGASVVEMQIAGRWRDTSMPAHYARAQLAGTGAVARLRYGCKNKE